MKKFLPLLLLALAGCSALTGDGTAYTEQNARDGAAFRAEAREVYGRINPVCPYTAEEGQLARYDEPRARYDALKKWVAGTPFTIDLAMIEGEFDHYWTVNDAECGPTDTEEGLVAFDAELNDVDQRLSALEQMAGMI